VLAICAFPGRIFGELHSGHRRADDLAVTGHQRGFGRWIAAHPFAVGLAAGIPIFLLRLGIPNMTVLGAAENAAIIFVGGVLMARIHRWSLQHEAAPTVQPPFRPAPSWLFYLIQLLMLAAISAATRSVGVGFLFMACIWLVVVLSFVKTPDFRNRGPVASLARWTSVRPLRSALAAGSVLAVGLSASVGRVGGRLLAIAFVYGALFGLAGVLIRRRLGHA
jgi:hypothetical protein